MLWSAVHDTFLDMADALPELVQRIADFTTPALGKWDVSGLCGHTLRAIRLPVHYLAEPEPDGGPMEGAAEYYLAYLRWRDDDPAAADASIATRGNEELEGVEPGHFPQQFREAAWAARAALQAVHAERKIQSPFGIIRIHDYLRTRNLELVVHAIDLARAAGIEWRPPDVAVNDALVLLTEIARARGCGEGLLMVLLGREHAIDCDVLPVIR